jgi:hypothetical protein
MRYYSNKVIIRSNQSYIDTCGGILDDSIDVTIEKDRITDMDRLRWDITRVIYLIF